MSDNKPVGISPIAGAAPCSTALVRHIWEVHTRIPNPAADNTTIPCQMSLVAEHVNQVWDYIAADRMDERTEVVAIIRREPVVAVLPLNTKAEP